MNKKIISLLSAALVTSLVLNCGKKEEKPAEAPASAPSVAINGKEVYTNNACSTCHGEAGLGDGAAGAQLKVKPRNFKAPTAEWKNGKSVEGIVKTLKEGIVQNGMAPYTHLSEGEMTAVANYILEMGQ